MDPDARYARGEITRDEWLRLRASAGSVPPASPAAVPAPPARAPGRRVLLVIAVVAVAAVVLTAMLLWTFGNPTLSGWSPSYGTVRELSVSDLSGLNASATVGAAFTANHTLWFHGGVIDLVVYASPPDHDMAFAVQGMGNPTIHMPAGTRVTITLVNADSGDYHNWALTRTAPPYGTMPMMGSSTMMAMSMLGPASASGFWSQALAFTTASGSYWYLCQYMTHAADGMYGGFVVG